RVRQPLPVADPPLPAAAVLQLDHEAVERLAVALLDAEVADVALLLQEARDVLLQARGRHRRRLLESFVRIADSRQHVGNRISEHSCCLLPVENANHFSRLYPELLAMPGIKPWGGTP